MNFERFLSFYFSSLPRSLWMAAHQPLFPVLHHLPTSWVQFMSAPRESPLDVAAYNVIPCHWLAEPICTTTCSTRIQAFCLSAALTPAWLGPARGLGTPQSYGGQPDSGKQNAVGGCCKKDGCHLPGTDIQEGQLSNRQLKLKCLPKATLARGSPERKPQIREKILEINWG